MLFGERNSSNICGCQVPFIQQYIYVCVCVYVYIYKGERKIMF